MTLDRDVPMGSRADIDFQMKLHASLYGAPTRGQVAQMYETTRRCLQLARCSFQTAQTDPSRASAHLDLTTTWLMLAVRDREMARRLRRRVAA